MADAAKKSSTRKSLSIPSDGRLGSTSPFDRRPPIRTTGFEFRSDARAGGRRDLPSIPIQSQGNQPTWRRFHGEFVATVLSHDRTKYSVVVSHEPSSVYEWLPRVFGRVESAKAAADDAVRRRFSHKCTLEKCGDWAVFLEGR